MNIELIGVGIVMLAWAPYAFEQKGLDLYRSWYGKLLLVSYVTFAILYWQFNISNTLILPWLYLLILISIIDIKHKSIRIIDLGLLLIFSIFGIPLDSIVFIVILVSIFAGLLFGVKYLLSKWYGQTALGGADIIGILSILICMGGKSAIIALYGAVISSAIVGIYMILILKKSRKTAIPFIPFLAFGVITSLLFSEEIYSIYIKLAM